MGLYKKSDLVQVTYDEFGQTMDLLVDKILSYQQQNNIKFNLVVPLLRSGAFPAFHIAAHLEIKNILPVYYMYQQGKIVKRIETPKIVTPLPKDLHILICDSCLVSGTTYKEALADIESIFPGATFYAVAIWFEEGIEELPHTKHIFWGKRTNEKGNSLIPESINGLVVAPWEDFEIDWNEVKDY